MKVAPKKWTHHHTRRIFHLAALVPITAIVIFAFCMILVIAWQAQGDTTQSNDIKLSATVGEINPGPTVVDSGGASSGPAPTPTETPALTPVPTPTATIDQKPPEVTIVPVAEVLPAPDPANPVSPEETQTTIAVPGVGVVPFFHSSAPTFSGHTNIPYAWIYLEIHSTQVIRATTQADANGDWTWQATEPINNGTHTMTVTSADPNDDSVRATVKFSFYVKSLKPLPKNNSTQNQAAQGNGASLFDILVSVPTQFQQIHPGDDLVADIKLINFGQAGHPVDVGVEYTIEDSKGNQVMQSSETVAVATQTSFLKTFFTSPDLAPGTYKLVVRVPSENLIATSTTSFQIAGSAVYGIGNGKIDYTTIFQAMVLLFLFFCLVGYMEYNRVSSLSGIIKQIDESDLASEIK